jgi:hypothetical protein
MQGDIVRDHVFCQHSLCRNATIKTFHHYRVTYRLVSSLFHDALSVTRLYCVDDMVISEWWWSEKNLVGSGCGLISGTITAFAWRDWGKPRNTSIGDRDRDFNLGPPEYEAGVLTTRRRRSVRVGLRYCRRSTSVVDFVEEFPSYCFITEWSVKGETVMKIERRRKDCWTNLKLVFPPFLAAAPFLYWTLFLGEKELPLLTTVRAYLRCRDKQGPLFPKVQCSNQDRTLQHSPCYPAAEYQILKQNTFEG